MQAIKGMKRFFEKRPVSKKRHLILATIAFFLILGYFFLTWPIVAYDTDLWYHLSGGRYFFEHHHIANESFFSFLQPVKHWLNYYWLFQIIAFKIFSHAGYYGLIVFRGLLFLATAYFIFLQVEQKDGDDAKIILSTVLFTASVMALTGRELLIRPHLVTYLFIAVFLYLLEKKQGLLYLLPLLGIAWCNIHGIEYPVMILIVLAYLAEYFWHDRKNPMGDGRGKHTNWCLIATCYTALLTPGGIDLLQAPFESSFGGGRFQYLYISELQRMPWRQIFTLALLPFSGIVLSLQNFLVLSSLAAILMCLYRRNVRISHCILFGGATVLLLKHSRFIYEFILLSLPMILQGIKSLPGEGERPSKNRVFYHVALPLVLIVAPLIIYAGYFRFIPRYPLSSSNLPAGNAAFLNYINVGGRVMNYPNNGGYLQWALNGKYKIAMDLQMSLFSDEDYAAVSQAFYDKHAFAAFTGKYDPSFVTVLRNLRTFREIVSLNAQFIPVFFDGQEVLFVNQDHFRPIADRYRLKVIDPFTIRDADFEKMDGQTRSAIYNEASRIIEIDATNTTANWLVGTIMAVNGKGREALARADIVISAQPESPTGYALKADALRVSGRYREAVRFYKMAIERGAGMNMKAVYRNLFVAYNQLHEYKKAYELYSRILNPFAASADYKEIYELAISALAAGKQKDAILFMNMARAKLPPDDEEYGKKIGLMLSLMEK